MRGKDASHNRIFTLSGIDAFHDAEFMDTAILGYLLIS